MTDAATSPLAGPAGGGAGPRAAPTPAPAGDSPAAQAAGDFETFLKLLTTQMRNQDPLKPVESTEFVAQLASFSAVEQQIRSNDRLDAILAALGGDGAGLAEWIGKEVQAAAAVPYDGEPLGLEVDPPAEAERAILVVETADGTEVARLAVDPTAQSLTWSGETGAGEAAPGAYRFSVEYLGEDALIESRPGRVYAEVVELRLGGEEPMLVLAGGEEISADAVTAIRAGN
ncbi:flagellar hook capping FlgD N-terminal domain-containing protein [Albimonas pacifica]|uniref:Basal-body rod modification protein FlgD n=1 Tax=Albimonas pacifica TaxID=1114924 RepID=A0A1I3IHR2_9RHOB|nr:flagellar hook capping FlgD N-terminal domain-containing protein [Albimonas pacifica]SFI47462.1 flagellar basal-body rod modification protein FlgD [Albimonas pacifica]